MTTSGLVEIPELLTRFFLLIEVVFIVLAARHFTVTMTYVYSVPHQAIPFNKTAHCSTRVDI